jgi:hypothetical protein
MLLITRNLAHLPAPADHSLPLCGVHRPVLYFRHQSDMPMCQDCLAHLDALNEAVHHAA